MNKWITSSDLCSRWKTIKYNLAELVFNGKLQAHYGDDFSAILISDGRTLLQSREGHLVGERQIPLTPGDVADVIFLISDVEEFEKENGITPHGIKKPPGSRKPTDGQKDKKKAIKIANEYIVDRKSEDKTPRIYEAVVLIKKSGKLSRNYTGKHTIHDWIKEDFPPESRKAGQGRPKKE